MDQSILKRFSPRPALAAFLALLATGLPAAAWLQAGQDDLDRRIEHLEYESRLLQNDRATKLAAQLADRLANLRSVEAIRPHYHYTNPYHETDSGELIVSPLASGPADPAILGYFLVNPDGGVALPSLGETQGQAGLDRDDARRRRLRERLAGVSEGLLAPFVHVTKRPGRPGAPVLIGPLRWRQVSDGEETLLLASRYLATMDGTWAQGFVLDTRAVELALSSKVHPVRFVTGRPSHVGQAALNLPGVTWRVALDLRHVKEGAAAEAHFLRRNFTRNYRLGVVLALLAGAALVLLVVQTERSGRLRATFAAVAAHELRTPLAGLRLQAELLAEGLGDPSRTREKAGKIATEAERLSRVVRNVLDFTTLERGQLNFDPSEGDLAQVVRDTLERIGAGVDVAGATLDLDVEEGLPRVVFDEDAVTSILVNLVDNAVKYSSSATNRHIEVKLAHLEGETAQVELSVRDHGPGMPTAPLGRSFSFFHRGTPPSHVAGLGLGLALSARLATGLGGSLHVANDQGARVSLLLPMPGKE